MATKTEPFDLGDSVVFYADFTNAAGAPADPTDITLIVEKPDGTETTYLKAALSNPTVGRWEKAVTVDQHGRWPFVFRATGSIQLSAEGITQVRESRFAYP